MPQSGGRQLQHSGLRPANCGTDPQRPCCRKPDTYQYWREGVFRWYQYETLLAMIVKRHLGRSEGFTLIELLTTIVLAAILLAVAAPNFMAFQRNSELTSAANSMLA